ncbi:MAG TPA: hypothetical protein VHC49_00595 [Mycobacteriales bacterium]|nr:hypothetical protein [Mycobacteriales bacterium]
MHAAGAATKSTPPAATQELGAIVARLAPRVAPLGVHPDVVEAAVRSAWTSYRNSRVQQFRVILTEREAYRRILSRCTVGRTA